MARRMIDENMEEDVKLPVSPSPPSTKKAKEIKYKRDRTGWIVLPFAFLLALICVVSVFISISEDPSGGIAGQTIDAALETIASLRAASDTNIGNNEDGSLDTDNDNISGSAVDIDNTNEQNEGDVNSVEIAEGDINANEPTLNTNSAIETAEGSDLANETVPDTVESGEPDIADNNTVEAVKSWKPIHSLFDINGKYKLYTESILIPLRADNKIDINAVSESSISSGFSLKEMMKGSWENNVYTNQFAEFTLTLANNWEMRSESDSYTISSEDVVSAYVVNTVNGDNILIRFFNMSVTSGGQEVYEDNFLEGMKRMGEQDENLKAVFGDVFQVNVGSNQYKGIQESVTGVINLYYLARRIGDYMSIISIKSDGELGTILQMFQ